MLYHPDIQRLYCFRVPQNLRLHLLSFFNFLPDFTLISGNTHVWHDHRPGETRLAYSSGENHIRTPQGHDKGPASGLSDWPHCAGKLTYGIRKDLASPRFVPAYFMVISTVLPSITLMSRNQRFSGFRLLVVDCWLFTPNVQLL